MRHVSGSARHANGRLDHASGGVLRRVRHQTDLRPRQSGRGGATGILDGPRRRHGRMCKGPRHSIASNGRRRRPRHRCLEGAEPNDYLAASSGEPPFLEIGRLRGLFDENAEPTMRKAFESACDRLQEAGMAIIDCPLPAAFSEVISRHQNVMAVESASFHEPRIRVHPEDYPPRIRSLIEEGLASSAPEYARTKEHQKALKSAILESFCDGVISAITPATPGPAPDAATTGPPTFNSPWSYVGFPTVNIPIGWSDDGLPLATTSSSAGPGRNRNCCKWRSGARTRSDLNSGTC